MQRAAAEWSVDDCMATEDVNTLSPMKLPSAGCSMDCSAHLRPAKELLDRYWTVRCSEDD